MAKRTETKRVLGGIGLLLGALATFLPSPSLAAEPERSATVVSVMYSFLPTPIVISSGSSLQYANLSPSMHSLTSDEFDPKTNQSLFDSGWVGLASQASVAGTEHLPPNIAGYPFHCELHPSMTGTLIVLPA